MWYVFDCRYARGIYFRTRHRLLAKLVAQLKGPWYDYGGRKEAFPRGE